MNPKQKPEEPESYISSVELSEVMTYAENPHREEISRQINLANQAGVTAGKAFISTLIDEIDTVSSDQNNNIHVASKPENALKLEVSKMLTPEQLRKTEAARTAMAVQFEYLGARAEDFKLIMHAVTDEKGEKYNRVTLIFAADKGLDLGDPKKSYDPKRSWNGLTDTINGDNFTVDVDGHKFDTRSSTDLALLEELAKTNPQIYEWIWRTGEPEKADAELAPFAYLESGDANCGMSVRRSSGRGRAFRPAVIIAKI